MSKIISLAAEQLKKDQVENYLNSQKKFKTILADPAWRFDNRFGRVAPENSRLFKYPTMDIEDIKAMGEMVKEVADDNSHLYLWGCNAMLPEALEVMDAWGFTYKTSLLWVKTRKDGIVARNGMGHYFRNATEYILFGVRGKMRTLDPARTLTNILEAPKRAHSQKPEQQYSLIEAASPGPYLELFARGGHPGWTPWGNEANTPIVFPTQEDVSLQNAS
jgi:N6-adenosine-specific RNA methylase IME4